MLDFSQIEVRLPKQGGGSEVVKTCFAAKGFTFAARTTDGPGEFGFKQRDDQGSPFWRLVRNVFKKPNKEQVDCQHPKPILLDTGEMKQPNVWAGHSLVNNLVSITLSFQKSIVTVFINQLLDVFLVQWSWYAMET
ncbi:neutral ceramidase 3-like [Mangifera indica]|uniref:neutral ceramidase 3-like n=1 Tax=Mangifera indica TaxID=29780 RepID=UPI001CFB8EF6|nr:neutral ceramidase 3-like [Mangifera indica]